MDVRRWRGPIAVLLLGLILTITAWRWAAATEDRRDRRDVENALEQMAVGLEAVVTMLQLRMAEAQGALRSPTGTTPASFERAVGDVVHGAEVPGVKAVAYLEPRNADPADPAAAAGPGLAVHVVSAANGPTAPVDLSGVAEVRAAFVHARDEPGVSVPVELPADVAAAFGGEPGQQLWLLTTWSEDVSGWVTSVVDPAELLEGVPAPENVHGELLVGGEDVDDVATSPAGTAIRGLDLPSVEVPGGGDHPIYLVGRVQAAGDALPELVVVAGVVLTTGTAGALILLRSVNRRLAAVRRSPIDELTGLPNRAGLGPQLSRLTAAGDEPALLFVDVDRFKLINDTLGHAAGDDVLVAVARSLEAVRPAGGLAARWGGDEFVVVCPAGADEAAAVGEALLERATQPVPVPGGEVAIALSVGVAEVSRTGTTEEALAHADAAMYEAKRSGGDRLAVADERPVVMDTRLATALGDGSVVVDLQPVAETGAEDLLGPTTAYVAQARWPVAGHRDRAGDEVAEIASRLDLTMTYAEWLIREAVRGLISRQADGAAASGSGRLPVIVPLADGAVLDPNLPEVVGRVLEGSGTDPDRLVVAVSERLLAPAGQGPPTVDALRTLGIGLACAELDGRSAPLAALSAADLDAVLLEPRWVDRAGADDPVAVAFVRAICAWGRELSFDVIATAPDRDVASSLAAAGVTALRGTVVSGRDGAAQADAGRDRAGTPRSRADVERRVRELAGDDRR